MTRETTRRRAVLGSLGVVLGGTAGCLATPLSRGAGEVEPRSPRQTRTRTGSRRSPSASPTPTPTPTEASTPSGDADDLAWWTPRGSVLDSFDAFEREWVVAGGTATATASPAFDGGQAVRLDSAGGNRFRIERQLPEARDFRDLEFSMAVRLDETTKPLVQVGLVLIDIVGNQRTLSGSIRPEAAGRWVRFDLGVRDDEGADMGAIAAVRVDHWTGDDETVLYVDDIRVHSKPPVGHVMFTFDDHATTEHSVAFPTLRERGYAGTCFPPIDRVTADSTPSIADYQEMRAHGWVIGGHTLDHERLTEHTRDEQRRILEENVTQLREKDLADPPLHFRTPYSSYDANSLDLMTESFDTAIIGCGSATGTNVHVTDHRTIGFRSGDDLESAVAAIDAAAEYRQLLGLTLHMDQLDGDHLRTLVERVSRHERAGRLEVVTPTDLYEAFVLH